MVKERTSKEKVASKLARRNYSSWELKRHFQDTIPEIDEILNDFKEQGYLDDEEWVKSFIRVQEGKGKGPSVIYGKLAQKGVPKQVIQEALQTIDSKEALESALSKKMKGKAVESADRSKIISYLMRRGFSWDAIQNRMHQF